ncbi:MAG: hypothetical protein KKA31_01090 [Candidatus Margulisbacteria bacterium]|nr:hypothetical protein [Candidatus Margulisiibacteriota bacterium]
MKNKTAWFLSTWWAIILRPIYFYTVLPEEDWREKALTFLFINSWILAFAAALFVFFVQYAPIGKTLVQNISGFKFILILPVLIALAGVFFLITVLILGGFFVGAFFAMFYVVGLVLHYIYALLGGKGKLNKILQQSFYSSAVLIFALLIILLMFLTSYGLLGFSLFRAGFIIVYGLVLLYVYGLWAVAGRKTYAVSKPVAFIGALLPVIILLIFGVLFDKIALPVLQPWIS